MPELPKSKPCAAAWRPAMEGARFVKVEVRRPRPALAVAEGLRQAARGQDGRGPRPAREISAGRPVVRRRAADASRHVGLVPRRQGRGKPGDYYHEKSKSTAHDHVVFHMSNGATVTFNDPRRFGSMKLVRAREARRRAAAARSRPRAARQRIRRGDAGAGLRRQEDVAEGGAARPARRRRARQHLCLRGAVSRAPVAEAAGLDDRRPQRHSRTSAPSALVDAIKAVLNDAIKAGGSSLRDHRRADGSLGDFQHNFRVYDREGEPCPTPAARARSSASCRPAARRSIVRRARSRCHPGLARAHVRSGQPGSGERRHERLMTYETSSSKPKAASASSGSTGRRRSTRSTWRSGRS